MVSNNRYFSINYWFYIHDIHYHKNNSIWSRCARICIYNGCNIVLRGIQLVFLGVIGEYLGRAFYETKGRPLYFIDRYNEIKETNKDLNEPRNLL